MTTLSIGSTVWIFDENYRVYTKDGPGWGRIIYREHFRPHEIVGETGVSWVLDDGRKVNKKTLKTHRNAFEPVLTSEEDIDKVCWMREHRQGITRMVGNLNRFSDYDKLISIADMVGYKAVDG